MRGRAARPGPAAAWARVAGWPPSSARPGGAPPPLRSSRPGVLRGSVRPAPAGGEGQARAGARRPPGLKPRGARAPGARRKEDAPRAAGRRPGFPPPVIPLVDGPGLRVAQGLVGLADAEEDGLALLVQVGQRGVATRVRVEGSREKGVGRPQLRGTRLRHDTQELEVVSHAQALVGLLNQPSDLLGAQGRTGAGNGVGRSSG